MSGNILLSDVYIKKKDAIQYVALSNDLKLYIGTQEDVKLTVSASKNIFQENESITLWARIQDKDNNNIEGLPLGFVINGTLTEPSISNSEGMVSYTYEGRGIGKTNIQSKSSNLQSTPYEVTDCTFYDKGIKDDLQTNDKWYIRNATSAIRTRMSDGTYIDVSDITLSDYVDVFPNAQNSQYESGVYIPKNTCIEFDIVDVDNTSYVYSALQYIREGNVVMYPKTELNKYTAPYHVKIYFGDIGARVWIGDTEIPHSTYNDIVRYKFSLSFPQTTRGTYLKYKNFKRYPIFDDTVSTITTSASTPIIQSGGTSTIQLTPKGTNGFPVQYVDVDVYKDNVKVDTVNSGDFGVAEYSYTGTGAGLKNFKGVVGNIQSEPYPVYDCIFEDTNNSKAISDYTPEGTQGYFNFAIDDNAKCLSVTTQSRVVVRVVQYTELTGDIKCSFKLKTLDYCNLGARYGNNSTYWSFSASNIPSLATQYIDVEFQRVNGEWSCRYSVDGETWTSKTPVSTQITDGSFYVNFNCGYSNADPSLKKFWFKDVKVYPI